MRREVRANGESYPVIVERGSSVRLGGLLDVGRYSAIALVADETLKPLGVVDAVLGSFRQPPHLLYVPSGEDHKSVEQSRILWEGFRRVGLDRRSLVINLGGGMVTDLAGFAAATYMRGIEFVQLPSTLLAQVDASVGGKVGINVGGVKNLVGAFRQPSAVVADPDLLITLPPREFRSGFAEILKHGIIADREYFTRVVSAGGMSPSHPSLAEIIFRSVEIKASIVEEDPEESGGRKLLNAGHTVGHAIEALSHECGAPLLHGEAVAIGLLAEARIAARLGLLSPGDITVIADALTTYGLPIRVTFPLPFERVAELMKADKKSVGGSLRLALPRGIGVAVYDVEVPLEEVALVLGSIGER